MDTLTLKSIRLQGRHGVYEDERIRGNLFELDVILYGDFGRAGGSDDLADTIDYEQIERTAAEIMAGPPHQLIESLCREIGDRLFELSGSVREMELALRKIAPPLKSPTAYAEIRMRWRR